MSVMFIRVKVKPNCPAIELQQQADGTWLARVKGQPVDGKANEELIVLVARHFRCSKSAVAIKSGASSRTKLLAISTA